jgi:hypothetical protein
MSRDGSLIIAASPFSHHEGVNKYLFAYFDHVPQLDWNAAFIEYIPKVLEAGSTQDY